MKDHLTILQNFIITNESILNHLKSDVGLKATSNVLGECKWVVNYKTSLYLDEIKTLYNNYLTDYDLYNKWRARMDDPITYDECKEAQL